MTAFILDAAGYVTGTCDGMGPPGSIYTPPPGNAAHPHQFVNGAWVVVAAGSDSRIITRLAFRRRFTMGEKTAIEMAALDQPNASSAVRLQSAQLRAFLKDADAAENITLDDATTRAGVALLVAAGLLSAGRDAEILDAPVLDTERPN